MNRKDFRPNDEYSSTSSSSKSYELNPQYDARKSFYGKARVEVGKISGTKKLYSYDTLVAEIDNTGTPIVYNTQSQTTVRHVKEFLKQNGYKADSKGQIEKDYSPLKPSISQKEDRERAIKSGSIPHETEKDKKIGRLEHNPEYKQTTEWNKPEGQKLAYGVKGEIDLELENNYGDYGSWSKKELMQNIDKTLTNMHSFAQNDTERKEITRIKNSKIEKEKIAKEFIYSHKY